MQWTFIAASGITAAALVAEYSGIHALGAVVGAALFAAAWGTTLGRRDCLAPVVAGWAGFAVLAACHGPDAVWQLLVRLWWLFLCVACFLAIGEAGRVIRAGGARR